MTHKPKTPGRGSLPSAEVSSPRAGLSAPEGGTATDGADPSTGERMRAAGEVTGPESRDAREAQHGAGGGVNRPHAQDRCACEGHHVCAACAALTPEQPPMLTPLKPDDIRISDTRARARRVATHVRSGTPINHACALERVPRASFYEWMAQDPQIALDVGEARAVAAEAARRVVLAVALGEGEEGANANVLLHLLERAHPDEYAPPKQRVETTGADGGPQRVEHSGGVVISNPDAKRIARKKQGT